MFDWIDPRADGACGSIREYVQGNLNARGSEVHWGGPTSPPSGKEMHCIRPGTYLLTLTKNGVVLRTFVVDYVPEHGVPNGSLLISDTAAPEYIGATDYSDTTYNWEDVWVTFDLGAGGGSDIARVRVDNGGSDPYSNPTFVGDPAPSGGKFDYFRISSRTSTTSGVGHGRLLSRLYWDVGGNLAKGSGYYDSHSQSNGLLRIHQFSDAQQSQDYSLGLETMRPQESPADTPTTSVPIGITVSEPPPPPPPLANAISGPDLVTPSTPTSYQWEQSASGGVPPYSYGLWRYYRYPGPETTVGTGKFFTLVVAPTVSAYVFRLKATVSDGALSSLTARYFVEVMPAGKGLLAPGGLDGVRFPDGSCRLRPTQSAARQRWLSWVFESRQGLEEPCRTNL
jgi:hypothetical protein